MSTFKALNVDSDHESEDEVDDTKEIQIEEALKLYQAALKSHSEGPASFERTAEAYKALFESEIFKYPESLSEYKRHELYGENLVFDSILEDEFDASPVQPTGANDSAPNTLQQILHLSFKNHGQFLLQTMEHWIKEQGHDAMLQQGGLAHALNALDFFAEALDKEDTDLDLWLRTASVAALLGSQRITRFCLEAVLDGDDEVINSVLRLPGLEEGFAGQQLRELVQKLEDSLSLMQTPMSSMSRKRLSATLKKRLNPYPFAPLPSEAAKSNRLGTIKSQPERIVLTPTKWDWAGVGEAMLLTFQAENSGRFNPSAGSAITINIPTNLNIDRSTDPNKTPPLDHNTAGASAEHEPPLPEGTVVTTNTENHPTPANSDQDVDMQEPDKGADNTAKDGEPGEAENTTKDKELGEAQNTTKDGEPGEAENTPQNPSRKRSTDSAGLPETADGARLRSKRIRARDTVPEGSTAADSTGPDLAKQLEDKLYPFTHADKCLFEIVNDSLQRLGIANMGSPEKLRAFITSTQSPEPTSDDVEKVARDLYRALQSGSARIAPPLLSNEVPDLLGMTREAGLSAFLGYAKTGITQTCVKPVLKDERLVKFATQLNENWLTLNEAAFNWLEFLLVPGSFQCPGGSVQETSSSYIQYRWAEGFKRHLVQILVNFDEFIYERMASRIAQIDSAILKTRASSEDYEFSEWDAAQVEMAETIYELHLDVYSLIKHPHSGVDANTRIHGKDRLERWAMLARDGMQLRNYRTESGLDQLALRHIWASVFQMSVSDEIPPEHVIYALEELKSIFESMEGPLIEVQNNAVMPELSIAAVDRELARISMKDFFLKAFDPDEKDPVTVIESLEPILEPVLESQSNDELDPANTEDPPDSISSSTRSHSRQTSTERQVTGSLPSQEMRRFLDTASVSLRISLWERLREAYEKIEYPPKVVSCYLRTIEIFMGEMKAWPHQVPSDRDRYNKIMGRLRIVDGIVVKVLYIVKNDKTAFDCLSYEQLQTSMTAIADLLRIMSAANMLEDLIRVGNLSPPRFEGAHHGTFGAISGRLHDMQLRAWMLQYHLLKEGISQNPAAFPTPSEEQFEFLRHVHYATGLRNFCHQNGRQFLRLAKEELLRLDDVIDGNTRDTEVAQVLYDLYGMKSFIHSADCHEFSTATETLDKRTAFQLLPFLLSQARKIDPKDLPKTDLKVAIDKVHGALGRPKTNEDTSMNRKLLTTYCRLPIDPVSLYDCVKGLGSVATKHIDAEMAVAASQGWFFLMGNIALSKFRTQKRTTPGPTEDLHFAQAFFLQDLEYSVERWETWYRLAQANDTQLEECVTWSADKMNSNSMELISFQRSAIHCYVQATACAVRAADPNPQTMAKVSEMYTDFGNRIYSSSREPFNMNAFNVKESENRYLCYLNSTQIYRGPPFKLLSQYQAWKFASVLFKRAIQGKPDKWWNHYMLAKCLWKMFCAKADESAQIKNGEVVGTEVKNPPWDARVARQELVAALVNTISVLPEKRERGREPILEPHYKLVSITYKLVHRKEIDFKEGEQMLRNTSYSQNIPGPENADDWERYVLAVLKALRTADKVSWHHRMIARTAHVIYDDTQDAVVAQAAKHELTQQMFTKTMAVQVWRHENERPGRHFVFTSRYTRFFNQLLDQTNDKTNMELLLKRVRRKQHDFFEHSKLWQAICEQYLRLLRRIGHIEYNYEETIFKVIPHDEFVLCAARLEAYCQDPATSDPTLDILRDLIELKRLNSNLMKVVQIDDAIGDTYATLYAAQAPRLPPLPSEQPKNPLVPPQQLTHTMAMAAGAQPGGSPFPVLNQVQVDGAGDPRLLPGQIPVQIPFQVVESSRSRPKTIGRREVQRRAEAAAMKPAVLPPTPAATAASTQGLAASSPALPSAMAIRSPPPISHPQVVIPSPTKPRSTPATPLPAPAPGPIALNNQAFVQNSLQSLREELRDGPIISEAQEQAQEQARELPPGHQPVVGSGSVMNVETVTNAEDSFDGQRVGEGKDSMEKEGDDADEERGNVDDDADDESELSELDDEAVEEIGEVAGVRDSHARGGSGSMGREMSGDEEVEV